LQTEMYTTAVFLQTAIHFAEFHIAHWIENISNL